MWSLRLRATGGLSVLLSVNSSMPLSDLQLLIQERSGIQTSAQKILSGFPPKPLVLEDATSPISTALHNMDTLIVENTSTTSSTSSLPSSSSSAPNPQPKQKKRIKKSTPASAVVRVSHGDDANVDTDDYKPDEEMDDVSPSGEPRRSSRKRVALSVAIEDPPPTKKKKITKSTKPPPKKTGIHGLTSSSSDTPKPSKPKKPASARTENSSEAEEPQPQELSLDDMLASALGSQSSQTATSTKSDEEMVDAFSKGVDGAKATLEEAMVIAADAEAKGTAPGGLKSLRAAFKTGLEVVQEETLAIQRYKAAIGGNYKFTDAGIHRLADGYQPMLKVSFLVEKEWREEMHEAFSTRELAAIFAYVLVQQGKDAREMFRPLTMAKTSPRTFWSLVKHFDGDVERGLKTILPKFDWSFLAHRKRNLSERGKQQDEQKELMAQADKLYKAEKRAKREWNRQIEQEADQDHENNGEEQNPEDKEENPNQTHHATVEKSGESDDEVHRGETESDDTLHKQQNQEQDKNQ